MQVAEALTLAILEEEWVPGDTLPSQAQLAESFSVSVVVIREALQLLQARGLIKTSQGRGTVVVEPDPIHAYDALKLLTDRKKVQLQDLYEIRSALEPYAAALAAKHMTSGQLQELEELVQPLQQPDVSSEIRREADLAFHEAIVKGAGNQLLCLLMKLVSNLMSEVLAATTATFASRGYPFHFEILQALKAGDSQAAFKAMSAHILRSSKRVLGSEDSEAVLLPALRRQWARSDDGDSQESGGTGLELGAFNEEKERR